MCFSASASFIASGVTGLTGVASLKETRKSSDIPLATIPFLFAIQQAIEGMIWLNLDHAQLVRWLGHAFSLFSNVLWPFYIPLAVYLVEPAGRRRKLLLLFLLAGSATSVFLLFFIIFNPTSVSVLDGHIRYSYGVIPNARVSLLFYLSVVSFAPLFSSHRILKLFGVLIFFSFLVSIESFTGAFFSVWCYFAAVLSIIIYLHFVYRDRLTLFDQVKEKLVRTFNDRF